VKALLQRFGMGPLRVGGFCNGAVIAFEIARQLRCHGVELDRVVLIDPSSENLRFRPVRGLLEGVRRVLPERSAVAVNARFLSVLELAHPSTPADRRAVFQRLRNSLFGKDAALPPADEDTDLARPEGMLAEAAREQFVRHVRRAVAAYVPGPIDRPVEMVLSSDLDVEDTRRLWSRVTTGTRAVQVSFPHIEMLRRDLPEVLRSLLLGPGHDRG
jgi:thioesterase domain-containing protein